MMVPFITFWSRLKGELLKLPQHKGIHIGKTQKWSQYRDFFGEKFVFLYKGGNVIECGTTTTNSVRSVSSSEFEKVYRVWEGYRSGEVTRTHIVHELGVQNASWII